MAIFSPRARISRSLGKVTAARTVEAAGLEWALMARPWGWTRSAASRHGTPTRREAALCLSPQEPVQPPALVGQMPLKAAWNAGSGRQARRGGGDVLVPGQRRERPGQRRMAEPEACRQRRRRYRILALQQQLRHLAQRQAQE